MSEENTELEQEVVQEESTEVEQETTNTEPSSIEKKALELGWRNKDQFDGDPEDFIDATEFVRRQPLFDKIGNVSKELRETKKALQVLQTHYTKVREVEYQNALKALKSEKKAALESGDADALIEIDDRIAETKAREQIQRVQQEQQVNEPHPNFINWIQRNTWYKANAEMKVVADQIGTAFAASNEGVDPEQVLVYVEKRIRKLYPEEFANQNRSRPTAVETSSPQGRSTSGSNTEYKLTEDERSVMNTLVRNGTMTKEEYIADLKKIKGEV